MVTKVCSLCDKSLTHRFMINAFFSVIVIPRLKVKGKKKLPEVISTQFHSGKLYSCLSVYIFPSSAAYSLNSEGNIECDGK